MCGWESSSKYADCGEKNYGKSVGYLFIDVPFINKMFCNYRLIAYCLAEYGVHFKVLLVYFSLKLIIKQMGK